MNKYVNLHQKYFREAEILAQKKDFSQASEKYWGATAELVKAIAEKRGWSHHRHRDLLVAVANLFQETHDCDLVNWFDIAQAMHANFYEDFMPEELFQTKEELVKKLIDKLKALNGMR